MKNKRLYKTCNGCKADKGESCLLGFSKKSNDINDIPTGSYKPIEFCYKPRTEVDLLSLGIMIDMGKA